MPDCTTYDLPTIQRQVAADMGRQADVIMRDGRYTSRSGREIEIADCITRAIRDTVYYPPECRIEGPPKEGLETVIDVRNEPTLAAARRLLDRDYHPVALNFASGTHPGGGYNSGSLAQEESLARSSALVACLESTPEFYDLHRTLGDPMFTDAMIYSRDVPFFRGCDHQLLDEPHHLSVISAAAPRANALEGRREEIAAAFERRIRRILEIALENGHDSVVLGAWGCGAYGNDPEVVSQIFRDSIDHRATGAFRNITFAILDHTEDRRIIAPFESALV